MREEYEISLEKSIFETAREKSKEESKEVVLLFLHSSLICITFHNPYLYYFDPIISLMLICIN